MGGEFLIESKILVECIAAASKHHKYRESLWYSSRYQYFHQSPCSFIHLIASYLVLNMTVHRQLDNVVEGTSKVSTIASVALKMSVRANVTVVPRYNDV